MGSPIDHSIQYGCGMAKVSCMNDLISIINSPERSNIVQIIGE